MRMPSKEIIVIDEHNREVANFLERLRAAGQLRVQLGNDVFSITMSAEAVSHRAREFLTRGGRISSDE